MTPAPTGEPATPAVPTDARQGSHLRPLWPEWQGAGADVVAELAPEFPLDVARRAYTVGTASCKPYYHHTTAPSPPSRSRWTTPRSRSATASNPRRCSPGSSPMKIIGEHDPSRITTLGGTCTVSVAPFTSLAARYEDDLAVVWIDSHPDSDTGGTSYNGYRAMAVSMITGHGDPEMSQLLPATVPPSRTALVVVTGFRATRARKLTPAEKDANRTFAAGRAPVEHGFAHLKNWRILTKLRTEPTRATHLLCALLVLTTLEATTDN
ncbi:transposase family protein [Streptomyces sp. FXJ1.172]|uniref:transposase family protein n=1 Tax=Streptomyces sp. FXJ1.172 TaxID=710705 RepID=UPI0007CF085A